MIVKAIIGRLAVAPDERMTRLPVHFGIPVSQHRRDIDTLALTEQITEMY